MTGFSDSPAALQSCSSKMAGISDELHAELNYLQLKMDGLLASGWLGQAARGFAGGWEQWQAGAHEVLQALGDMSALLGVAGGNYARAEQSSARLARDAGAGL